MALFVPLWALNRFEKIAHTFGANPSKDSRLKGCIPPYYEFTDGEYRFLFHETTNEAIQMFCLYRGRRVKEFITFEFIEAIGNAKDFIVQKFKNQLD